MFADGKQKSRAVVLQLQNDSDLFVEEEHCWRTCLQRMRTVLQTAQCQQAFGDEEG